ncbi:MAG: zonular occludens toxin domain-containing protein [Pseudomonadota bacterium]
MSAGTAIVRCVYGVRGGGKSTLARHLVANDARVIAFDPQRDYQGEAWRVATTRSEIIAALKSEGLSRFRISYCFDTGTTDPVSEMVWLADVIAHLQKKYRSDGIGLSLVVDEAHEAFPNRPLSKDEGPLRRLVMQGRHLGVGLTVVTQRPANISTMIRSQATEVYALALSRRDDRVAAADLREGAAPAVASLSGYDFVKITPQGHSVCRLSLETGEIRAITQ